MKDVKVGQKFVVNGKVMQVVSKREGTNDLGLFGRIPDEVTLVFSEVSGNGAMCMAGSGSIPLGFPEVSG